MIVAFGPPEDFRPVIPTTLVSREEEGLFLLRRDKRVATTEEKLDGFLLLGEVASCRPFLLPAGTWPLISARAP